MKHNRRYYERLLFNCVVATGFLAFLAYALLFGEAPEILSPLPAGAVFPTPTPKVIYRRLQTPRDYAIEWAYIYGVNPELIFCLVRNESGWRAEAKNPRSTAYGYGQFINSTWTQWRKQMKKDTALIGREDPNAVFETMAWALDKGYRNHWEADRKYCGNIPVYE